MWDWWPVVLQVRESTVSGLGNGSGPGTGKWSGERVASQVPRKSADRGRNGRGPETQRSWTGDGKVACRAYGVAGSRGKCGPGTEVPLTGDATVVDLGRESGLESVWRRRSWRKVQTGDGTAVDRGRNGRGPETPRSGPGTEVWNWWPVVLQVRESTVPGLGNESGPGTGKWSGECVASQVPGKSADLGRKCR